MLDLGCQVCDSAAVTGVIVPKNCQNVPWQIERGLNDPVLGPTTWLLAVDFSFIIIIADISEISREPTVTPMALWYTTMRTHTCENSIHTVFVAILIPVSWHPENTSLRKKPARSHPPAKALTWGEQVSERARLRRSCLATGIWKCVLFGTHWVLRFGHWLHFGNNTSQNLLFFMCQDATPSDSIPRFCSYYRHCAHPFAFVKGTLSGSVTRTICWTSCGLGCTCSGGGRETNGCNQGQCYTLTRFFSDVEWDRAVFGSSLGPMLPQEPPSQPSNIEFQRCGRAEGQRLIESLGHGRGREARKNDQKEDGHRAS